MTTYRELSPRAKRGVRSLVDHNGYGYGESVANEISAASGLLITFGINKPAWIGVLFERDYEALRRWAEDGGMRRRP